MEGTESQGTLVTGTSRGACRHGAFRPHAALTAAGEEDEFGSSTRKGEGARRPSHLEVLQPEVALLAAAEAAGVHLLPFLAEGTAVGSKAIRTK